MVNSHLSRRLRVNHTARFKFSSIIVSKAWTQWWIQCPCFFELKWLDMSPMSMQKSEETSMINQKFTPCHFTTALHQSKHC